MNVKKIPDGSDLRRVKRVHVNRACRQLTAHPVKVPKRRLARSTYVEFNGERLPAKYVLGLAHEFATGRSLDAREYRGGRDAAHILARLGYRVISKGSKKEAKDIESRFLAALGKEGVVSSGQGPQKSRNILRFENHGKGCHLLYATMAKPPWKTYLWAANIAWLERQKCPWSLILLQGSHRSGWVIPSREVRRLIAERTWRRTEKEDGYKGYEATVAPFPGSIYFKGPSQFSEAIALLRLGSLLSLKDEDLDDRAWKKIRKEQDKLRQFLFGDRSESTCGICGKTLPIGLLVVGHIKPRASCTPSEKRDRRNVMPFCLFGCDALFERGHIAIGKDGRVKSIRKHRLLSGLLREIQGRACTQYEDSKRYFDCHRDGWLQGIP